eukprot:3066260-Amphidinium_carterae.2
MDCILSPIQNTRRTDRPSASTSVVDTLEVKEREHCRRLKPFRSHARLCERGPQPCYRTHIRALCSAEEHGVDEDELASESKANHSPHTSRSIKRCPYFLKQHVRGLQPQCIRCPPSARRVTVVHHDDEMVMAMMFCHRIERYSCRDGRAQH